MVGLKCDVGDLDVVAGSTTPLLQTHTMMLRLSMCDQRCHELKVVVIIR
jgi:hypothetical protein